MLEHIHNSNLIEGIDDPVEDQVSLEAWAFLCEQNNFDLLTIRELHNRITKNQLPSNYRGVWRPHNVRVGNYLPPPHYVVPILMQEWVSFASRHSSRDAHVKFERIHPFVDGNGRVGRMLMWLHEIRDGLPPTLILASNVREYYSWFDKEEDGDF